MVDTTSRFGHLGYTVDRDNGDVLWGDSTCGAFGIEPLVRGAEWFGEPEYLRTAARLAEYYVTLFVDKGFTCGGVGDALMAVDSESSYALTAGLVHLHTATGRRGICSGRDRPPIFLPPGSSATTPNYHRTHPSEKSVSRPVARCSPMSRTNMALRVSVPPQDGSC